MNEPINLSDMDPSGRMFDIVIHGIPREAFDLLPCTGYKRIHNDDSCFDIELKKILIGDPKSGMISITFFHDHYPDCLSLDITRFSTDSRVSIRADNFDNSLIRATHWSKGHRTDISPPRLPFCLSCDRTIDIEYATRRGTCWDCDADALVTCEVPP